MKYRFDFGVFATVEYIFNISTRFLSRVSILCLAPGLTKVGPNASTSRSWGRLTMRRIVFSRRPISVERLTAGSHVRGVCLGSVPWYQQLTDFSASVPVYSKYVLTVYGMYTRRSFATSFAERPSICIFVAARRSWLAERRFVIRFRGPFMVHFNG